MKELHMIFITKLLEAKFVMYRLLETIDFR
jgi:hypothetical protein